MGTDRETIEEEARRLGLALEPWGQSGLAAVIFDPQPYGLSVRVEYDRQGRLVEARRVRWGSDQGGTGYSGEGPTVSTVATVLRWLGEGTTRIPARA